MRNSKKITAVISSVLMLAFTLAASGASTFAWFTRGTEAAASGFDFTASAASGIQISTDALNWASTIDDTDFDLTPGQPQEDSRLTLPSMEPISTTDNLTGGNYNFFGATSGDGNFTLAADTSNYLVFDLYFKNSGANELTLSLTSGSSVLDGTNNEGASLSTRVGFVSEGSDNVPAVATTLTGGVSSYIWEPNSTERTLAAQGLGATDSAKYYYDGINGDNASGAITDINAYNHLNANGAYTAPVTTTNDIAIGDSSAIATLAPSGQITKIKVFVWMEGQDIDSSNAASEGDVDIALAFDSGETVAKALATKTATGLTTPVATTEVAVSGAGAIGVEYTAFVFQTITDALAAGLDYRLYISTGSDTYVGSDITIINLGTEVSAIGTYDVVVVAQLTSFVGSRTSTPIIIS